MTNRTEWDGVERRHQDHDLWAALDLYDSQIERIRNRQCLTDEEVFEIHQRCLECRPRRRNLPVIVWALLLGALAVLVVSFS